MYIYNCKSKYYSYLIYWLKYICLYSKRYFKYINKVNISQSPAAEYLCRWIGSNSCPPKQISKINIYLGSGAAGLPIVNNYYILRHVLNSPKCFKSLQAVINGSKLNVTVAPLYNTTKKNQRQINLSLNCKKLIFAV